MAVVTAFAVPKRDSRENIVRQLSVNFYPKDVEAITDYLVGAGIESLDQVREAELLGYVKHIKEKNLEKRKETHYKGLLETAMFFYWKPEYESLLQEMDAALKLTRPEKNKVAIFLMIHDIHTIEKINYPLRAGFESYLQETGFEKKTEYVKILDKLKLSVIKRNSENRFGIRRELTYSDDILYLGYHPDYETAMEFYYRMDKGELVFDFSLDASGKLKRQVFDMLNHILKLELNRHNLRTQYLIPLRKLYLYCVSSGIEDLELLEEEDITGFQESMEGKVGTKTRIYMQIINNVRKFLFLSAKSTNWDANVWYLDRFSIKNERANPADHVDCLRFYSVKDRENRALLKLYAKYCVGISSRALTSVRSDINILTAYLGFCDKNGIKALHVTADQMDAYIQTLEEKDILPETFNKYLSSVQAFYRYLVTKGKLNKIPVQMDYYWKDSTYAHHDRSMSEENQMNLLLGLKHFPEHLRLMCLNLWATGLRINEVCAIKGNAYSYDGTDAYLTVFQYKQVSEKKIPIPDALYQIMRDYIRKNKVGSNEFVFKSKKGRAYDTRTFQKQVKQLCKEYGIGDADYIFRSHDLRHNMGTKLYDQGTSLQAIRDFLGHRNENMTKQYIDFVPKKIDEANRKYFDKEHLLNTDKGDQE